MAISPYHFVLAPLFHLCRLGSQFVHLGKALLDFGQQVGGPSFQGASLMWLWPWWLLSRQNREWAWEWDGGDILVPPKPSDEAVWVAQSSVVPDSYLRKPGETLVILDSIFGPVFYYAGC